MRPDCHIATGSPINGGYILVYVPEEKRQYLAHRLAWMRSKGPIPSGLLVCHSCDTPPCDNVEHLFLGTSLDNMRDAQAKGRVVLRTTCHRGHAEYSLSVNGKRRCRACHRENARRYKLRNKRLS